MNRKDRSKVISNYMNDKKIYSQSDLNDAVAKAICDMQKVSQSKEDVNKYFQNIVKIAERYQADCLCLDKADEYMTNVLQEVNKYKYGE